MRAALIRADFPSEGAQKILVIVYDSPRRRKMKVVKHAELKNLLAYVQRC